MDPAGLGTGMLLDNAGADVGMVLAVDAQLTAIAAAAAALIELSVEVACAAY